MSAESRDRRSIARAIMSVASTVQWENTSAYLKRHGAEHAYEGELLDELVLQEDFLLHANAENLLPMLWHVRGARSQLAATAYRTSATAHASAGDLRDRHEILRRDQIRVKMERPSVSEPDQLWNPRWVLGQGITSSLAGTLTGHTRRIEDIAFGLLDRRPVALTASWDQTGRIWDLATGDQLGPSLTGHTDQLTAVKFGHLRGIPIALTASLDGTARVWDLQTSRQIRVLSGHVGAVHSIAFGDIEGAPIAVTGGWDQTVRVWDLIADRESRVLRGHTGTVRGVAFGTVDRVPVALSAAWDGTLRVWNLLDGSQTNEFDGRNGLLNTVAFGKVDGTALAVTGGMNGPVLVWNLQEGTATDLLGEPVAPGAFTGLGGGNVVSVALGYLGDAPAVIIADDTNTATVWNLQARRRENVLTGHTNYVTAVALGNSGGQSIALTGSVDQSARIWDLTGDGRPRRETSGHSGPVESIALGLLRDRPVALTIAREPNALMWDLHSGTRIGPPLTGHAKDLTAVAFGRLHDGPAAVTTARDGTARVWDLNSWKQIGTLAGYTGTVNAVAFTRFGDRPVAAIVSGAGTASYWDLTVQAPARGGPSSARAFAPLSAARTDLCGVGRASDTGDSRPGAGDASDGSGSSDGNVGDDLRRLVTAVAFDRRGRNPIAVSAMNDGQVHTWSLRGETISGTFLDQTGPLSALALGTIGEEPVAIGAGSGGVALVWSLASRSRRGSPIRGHTDEVTAVALGAVDGKPIAVTGSRDETIRVWDLTYPEHALIRTILLPAPCRAVAVSAEGAIVAAAGDEVLMYDHTGR
ncbi:WD40 repeat domain-containing protein [Glycomyces harbinensis]|uniref:WD40 repeat n=1 Tax=Glycomyces harbinensis TaxID=58114 RepID=A0A1G7A536_9ACTN|nr:WD40 repeat domain-containing protein [Glycomyces harbinensis]SDE09006.1 WD40 repeat [Glycomyces harbinensis]